MLVLIDVEPLGERELHALGRYAYATTSRVRVDAYLAADGDAIGRGWSEQVEYAGPNAASKAEAAMGNVSTAVAEAIDAAWQDFSVRRAVIAAAPSWRRSRSATDRAQAERGRGRRCRFRATSITWSTRFPTLPRALRR